MCRKLAILILNEPLTKYLSDRLIICDPEGNWNLMQYLDSGYYPVNAPPDLYITWKGKISSSIFFKVKEQPKVKSLRQLAKDYGISHEAVRRALKAAKS